MHISSFPSKHGIGTFGTKAYEFVDFLAENGQKYWQILPIGPTSYGDSPYQSPSSFAGNPYFIDLGFLISDGLLKEDDLKAVSFGNDESCVDYGAIYVGRNKVFEIISERFSEERDLKFAEFCKENAAWLDDYALFMAIKEENNGVAWVNLDRGLKFREADAIAKANEKLASRIRKHKILQFLFYRQWTALKSYANLKGIKIIGDMPIYVAYDSCDAWCNSDIFQLDGELKPVAVAGCPPDDFSPTGQRWGNPLYDWGDEEKRDALYGWWQSRIAQSMKLFDIIRIDHFRGFADYCSIPAEDDTAERGVWCDGPGIEFFDYMREKLGELPIIAEDLGALTDKVEPLLKASGFPGMKVLQFAFDSDAENVYLPHNYEKNCVVYLGTHDNDTTRGWLESVSESTLKYAKRYMTLDGDHDVWGMIRTAEASVADTAIITVQDLLCLGNEGRMNTPSTDRNNWSFRVREDYLHVIPGPKLKALTKTYAR